MLKDDEPLRYLGRGFPAVRQGTAVSRELDVGGFGTCLRCVELGTFQ